VVTRQLARAETQGFADLTQLTYPAICLVWENSLSKMMPILRPKSIGVILFEWKEMEVDGEWKEMEVIWFVTDGCQ